MVNSLFNTILILSLKATITALAIILIKKIMSKFLLHRWHYYLWAILWIKLLGIKLPSSQYSFDNYTQSTIKKVSFLGEMVQTTSTNTLNITSILSIIWFTGTLFLFILYIYNYFSLYKSYKRGAIIKDLSFMKVANDVKNSLNLNREIKYVATDDVESPCVYSIINPIIFFPGDLDIEPDKLKHVLLHEMTHIKKYHVFFKQFCYLICIFHWFNPLLWYCLFKFEKEQELYCDEYLLNYLEEDQHTNYANTIVEYMGLKNNGKLLLTTSISPSFSFSYERIRNILYRTRVGVLNTFIYIIIFSLLVVAVFPEATILKNIGFEDYLNTYSYDLIEILGDNYTNTDPETASYLDVSEVSYKYEINDEPVEFIYSAYEEDVIRKVKMDSYMDFSVGMEYEDIEKKLEGYKLLNKGNDFLDYKIENAVLGLQFEDGKLIGLYLYSIENYEYWNKIYID